MFDSLSFYNHYGNGDLFISREFIKEVMDIIPAKKYYYATGKPRRMFADIPKINHIDIYPTPEDDDRYRMRSRCNIVDNNLFINTWLGVDSRYVTPANSCNIEGYLSNFNHILRELGVTLLTGQHDEYLPSIDYSYFNTKPIDDFLNSNSTRMVLIDTCTPQSGQASKFDMTSIVQRICDTFKKTTIITAPLDIVATNHITTQEITNSEDGFDLNEISYLSTYIDLLIGRSSGCYVFSMTRENCMNPNKTFLSFTHKWEASHIVYEMAAKLLWCSATSDEDVYEMICKVMKERNYE